MNLSPSPVSYATPPAARGRGYRPPGPAWTWAVRVAAIAAAAVSAYMLFVSLTNAEAAGCGTAAGCGAVLNSRWSRWIYLPVSALALPLYLTIFFATLSIGRPMAPPRRERRAWEVLAVLAVLAAGAAVWFVALQLLAVRGLCLYCMAVHACGLAVAGLVFTRLPVGRPPPPHEPGNPVLIPPRTLANLLLAGAAGLAVLVVGQLFTPEPGPVVQEFASSRPTERTRPKPPAVPATNQAEPATVPVTTPATTRESTTPAREGPIHDFHGGAVRVDQSLFPLVGNRNAPHVLAVMEDYTCPDCKSLHAAVNGARRRYGTAVAFIIMPMPLDADCNRFLNRTQAKHEHACELAKLALAVWAADKAKFAQMDDWLFENQPATPEAARKRAVELVGAKALREAEEGTAADVALRHSIQAYGDAGGGAVPKLMLPKATAVGRVGDTKDVYALLEKHLGVKPIGE